MDTNAPGLLLVGSGAQQYREYILAAVSRHFRVWLLDSDAPTWQLAHLEGATRLDVRDPQALQRAAREVMDRLPVAGVLTYDEWLVLPVARLARELGLPGSSPEAILACRDKARTRSVLTAAGVPQPAYAVVSTVEEAIESATAIGYPVVVKARDLAGSLGVVRADDPTAVIAAVSAAVTARYPGVPREGTDLLVEEYLTGPEISVDTVVAAGVCTPLVVARKQVGFAPYFEEIGHTVDGADPLLHDPELLEQLSGIHRALGFDYGFTHAEFKMTPGGPRLVEVNARLGGDLIPYLGMLATGVDPAVAAARAAVGLPPDTTPRHRRFAAVRFLYPEADCEVLDLTVHEDRQGPTVHRSSATVGPGTRLELPPRGYLSRYGNVIAVGDDRAQVTADLSEAESIVELHAKPLD
ncbi:ATP-grasp domain-containing protein [Nonomuraea cavernae]|uniref:Carboxylase n=1 Tax=Nonomuraea cavernae TaxID=2045107 RepID=A0A917YNM5_9ACTN|nr:ATP-grasp domain-containing protein [Nonomuraea cavernae]MCA2183591.1 ATP-grasp domain-containing protein [Nonomuraea cavernae]GGO60763.1 carboxylase [Nonomuraea cavernae]